jgi:hypothetical protein
LQPIRLYTHVIRFTSDTMTIVTFKNKILNTIWNCVHYVSFIARRAAHMCYYNTYLLEIQSVSLSNPPEKILLMFKRKPNWQGLKNVRKDSKLSKGTYRFLCSKKSFHSWHPVVQSCLRHMTTNPITHKFHYIHMIGRYFDVLFLYPVYTCLFIFIGVY